MKPNIFALLSTCMEVSVSLSCLFVHEPPYQTVVVYCNSVFRRNSLCMDQPYRFLRYSGACSGSPQLHEQHMSTQPYYGVPAHTENTQKTQACMWLLQGC